ncbi:MAG TPA: glycosyltransferase [Solirubrobacteraceae bacterium]|nr:glycosyltransferase [Solirubrobacteraceae bacterium]
MDAPEVTVLVPVRDRRERMLRCLDALLAQDHPSYEIVVLDNESADGTGDACRAVAARSRVPVRVERVSGTLGRVRNAGARLARGRALAFTDSDCLPAPGWLTAGVRALDADPGCGVVCGRTIPEHPPQRPWAAYVAVPEFSWRFESCNVFFRADAFRDSAGFDEVVGDGWEDTAAGFDLLRRGWRAGWAPDALVRHDVTYPGFWWKVRREQRQRNLAGVVGRYPEIRRRLLFGRVFFDRRSAAFFGAAVGLALGRRVPAARLLALPYVPFFLRPLRPLRIVQTAIYDASLHVALLRGALRYRRFLL